MLRLRLHVSAHKRTVFFVQAFIISIILHAIVALFCYFLQRPTAQLLLSLSDMHRAELPVEFVLSAFSQVDVEKNKPHIRPESQQNFNQKKSLSTTSFSTKQELLKKKPEVKKKVTQSIKINEKNEKKIKLQQEEKKKATAEKITKKMAAPRLAQDSAKQELPAQRIDEVKQISEPICIGQDEYNLIGLYTDIRTEIEKVWRRPVGVKPPKPCIVRVKIDAEGRPLNVEVDESSTIITYDLAAKMAVAQASFSPQLKHKELCIAFDV